MVAQLFDYLYFLVFKMKSKLLVTKQTSADFTKKANKVSVVPAALSSSLPLRIMMMIICHFAQSNKHFFMMLLSH